MRLCLVSAATATDFEDVSDAQSSEVRRYAETPHLGILALAGILDERGTPPAIINLNRCYYDYIAAGFSGVDGFANYAAAIVTSMKADVYGLSSICSSYPLTIRISQCIKEQQPGSVVVFGGPQASVVDVQTLSAFPFVDCVLRGEAEQTLPLLLDELAGQRSFSCVPGLTWRSAFGPVRNANAPVIQDLDALPLPAFHLTGELENAGVAPLEAGRGCPFACTFCSTNDFFRRKFRLKSPHRILADMCAIASRYGIRAFDLVHDMFTIDRRKVTAFCECMLKSGENFTWSCSARTDCVDEELLALMARSGCRGMFFGVETGSQRMQREIEKDLDVQRAREVISIAEDLGIETTVSLITGFPEETWDDLRGSMEMYMHSLRHPGSRPQFNLLAPLAETPVYSKYRDHLVLEELCSDMCHQGRQQNARDRELIRRHPDIFPNFYVLPVANASRDYLFELREFLVMGTARLRWLFVALHQTTSGILDVFTAWSKHRLEARPDLNGWRLREYYMLDEAQSDFVKFVLSQTEDGNSPAVESLAALYRALIESRRPAVEENAAETREEIPRKAPHVSVMELNWDIQGVIDRLKRCQAITSVDRTLRFFRTQPNSIGEARVIETKPLIAVALEACDGVNAITDVVNRIASVIDGPQQTCRLAAECLLETLRRDGLIEIHA